jgi:hypothetical protein
MSTAIYRILVAEILWLCADWLESAREGLLRLAGRLV